MSSIPPELKSRFLEFHEHHSKQTLWFLVLLANCTYLLYGLIDWLIIPDVAMTTFVVRMSLSTVLTLIAIYIFRNCKITWVDLYLPYATLIATVSWFYIIQSSQSIDLPTYMYASLVFVVIANLSVQVYFLPSLIPTALISLTCFYGVYHVNDGNIRALQIFSVAYVPILAVSLYISITNTHRNRRTFLRRALNEWHRNALDELAHTDMLTNLPNRRQFERLAQNELSRIERKYEPACLVMFDVDRFKRINDTHGHDVGDRVLQMIADITQSHWRSYDIVARFGGEEFIGLLPNTELDHALKMTDRLREKIQDAELLLPDGQSIHFTISAGVVEIPMHLIDLKTLIKFADQALYRAKKNGRNCVEITHIEAEGQTT